MAEQAKLHFALMCNQSNGGFYSGLTLARSLADKLDLTIWSLWGDFYDGHLSMLEATGAQVLKANPVVSVNAGDHLFFYMNDYPALFSNFLEQWQTQIKKAASVQIAFNRNFGSIPAQSWLSGKLTKIYFQNEKMHADWRSMIKHNTLQQVPCSIMAPPVDLEPFVDLVRGEQNKLVYGRLAGDGAVDGHSIPLYQKLADRLPDAEFWFMPTPVELAAEFSGHPQFRFFEPNEIPVLQFLRDTDIFLLTYQQGYPVPGPRSLVEAMAAGCAPVVVNREGPQARVIHGESGFCASNEQEFFQFAVELAENSSLRSQISDAARLRAKSFKVQDWVDKIQKHMQNAPANHVSSY